jgi:hypothetical protein
MPAPSLLDPDYQFGTSPLPGSGGAPTDLLGLSSLQVTSPPQGQPDLGDALGQTYQTISDYIARQREQSRQMGLLGDDGMPTVAPNQDITMNKVARRNDQLANLPDDLRALARGMQNSQQPVPDYAGSLFDRAPLNAPGLVAPGNINIHQRPVVRNADGSISTVRSMTFTDENGNAVLVPSVIEGRGIVSPQETFRHYKQTGQHLGIFDTPDNADAYAQSLHEQQAREYVPR